MSALEGVRRLRERPITGRERHTAMSAVAVVLTAATILLTAIRPAAQPHPRTPRPAALAARASRPTTPNGRAPVVAGVAVRVAREFLTGYLAYLYGHAPATDIHAVTPALARSLLAHPPLVSPAAHTRHPRVLSLRPAPAPAGLGVSALVNDGELASYPLVLLLARENDTLLVSAVQGA